jgi:beta-glucosidase
VKTSGFNFAFAPTVAVSHNPQWGRFYETMGDNTTEIRAYAKAYVNALQSDDGKKLSGVLASTKHFLGDGATYNGNDEGDNKVYNMKKFLEINMAGYLGALEANTGNIMVSYSAINDIAMSINTDLLQGRLKDESDFDGFLISDYDAVGKVSSQGKPTTGVKMPLQQAYLMSLNAGMDMIMQLPRDDNEVKRYF